MSLTSFAQQVNWMSWEDAIAANEVEPRKIFVDVYTQWCAYCKKMDRETFSNQYVAKYLNENYYPVKLDAQQKNDIFYKNKIYRFVNRGGKNSYHELAAEIMNGRLSYPTIVFLNEDEKVIQSIPGYRGALEFELFITYFGENHHKEIPWSSYKRSQPKGPHQAAPQINVKGNE
ncbi:MAG: DUF255 domain-containing protein [Bacteroidota bacterium]